MTTVTFFMKEPVRSAMPNNSSGFFFWRDQAHPSMYVIYDQSQYVIRHSRKLHDSLSTTHWKMSGSPGIVNQTPRSIRSIHCRQFYTPKSNVFFYSFYSFYSYLRTPTPTPHTHSPVSGALLLLPSYIYFCRYHSLLNMIYGPIMLLRRWYDHIYTIIYMHVE